MDQFVQGTRIKCDECGWKKPIQLSEVPSYIDEDCPDCGAPLIDEVDMAAFAALKALLKALEDKGIEPSEHDFVNVKFDSSKLPRPNN